MDLEERFAIAQFMREEYTSFPEFARLGFAFLGYPLTWMQADIAEYMQNGPRLRMAMAQRGEAKSTLAALYACWRLVQRPSTITLVVSAGEDLANQIAGLTIQFINQWDLLEYLRPDRRAGDRTSADAFDVHWSLKGINKSPSVKCLGITANLPGNRSDLLIADDIESPKNSLTVTQRNLLLHLTKEFSSINTHGDILYLGTPQSKDSIYNSLPGRGYTLRIWPGRYPTDEELEKYGERIAPSIVQRLHAGGPDLQRGGGLDGTRGKPADPDRFDESALVEKEIDQGPEHFQLQYMLDTSLLDAQRQQLKLSDFIVANYDHTMLPEVQVWQAAPRYVVPLSSDFPVREAKMYYSVPLEGIQFQPRGETIMAIDPAGGGSDEVGFAITTAIGPYIHVLDCGGLKGGLTEANGQILIDLVKEFNVCLIHIETNGTMGLFQTVLQGYLTTAGLTSTGIKAEYAQGQKERRIINAMVSALQRHRIILHERVFESDRKYGLQHSAEKRAEYSLFSQIANITTDRESLPHEDRLDALATAIKHWGAVLALNEEDEAQLRAQEHAQEFMQNPMGYDDPAYLEAQRHKRGRGTRRTIYARR